MLQPIFDWCIYVNLGNNISDSKEYFFNFKKQNETGMGHRSHAFWSMSIESRFECFVIVAKCKADSKTLTYSLFAGTKMNGYAVNGTRGPSNISKCFT